jgi:aspartyl aminopeptidase
VAGTLAGVPDPVVADLLAFITASPSPYHAVAEAARRLDEAGFLARHEAASWDESAGRGYVRRGGSLVAWSAPADLASGQVGFRVVGAHTDSPNLRIKPRPEQASAGWQQLGVEIYGGVLLNSWLDRDLGLAGRVGVRTDQGHELRLMRDDRALLRVPQLAIHLDRDVNQAGLKLNPQQHLTPLWGFGDAGAGSFAGYLAEQVGVDPDQVVSWDVMAHDVVPPTLAGRHDALISSARLDNQLSCWAAIQALTGAPDPRQVTSVVVLFDHEEIGSVSSTGADSDLLGTVLERLVLADGGDRAALLRALAASRAVSADGAHATHPNYAARHDPAHPVAVNAGPVIKHNANVRYATDADTAAWFESLCREASVPVQHFVSRDDVPCGSTIGPVTAARWGLRTVDVGVAQLAMHSIRELCGSADPGLLVTALGASLASPD